VTSLRRLAPCAWAVCLTATLTGGLAAQGATATVRVNLPVTNPITRLHAGPSSTDFGAVGLADMTSGFTDQAGPIMQVKSNQPFAVRISAVALTFDGSGKSSADVQWSPAPGGPFASLSLAGSTVLSMATGGAASQPVYFRILWSLAVDSPGQYTMQATFTITAP
jgi:hypothetical protein